MEGSAESRGNKPHQGTYLKWKGWFQEKSLLEQNGEKQVDPDNACATFRGEMMT